MANKSKYKKKFVKELLNGIRNDCYMSIENLCQRWNITDTSYYNWLEKYPEFKEAARQAEMDYAAATHRFIMDVGHGKIKGHGGVVALTAKNILGWKDKTETTIEKKESVSAITINVLPSKDDVKVIEHIEEPVESNILEFKPEEAGD